MAIVRVLRKFNGFPCGVYADVNGQELKDGVSTGALDEKAENTSKEPLFLREADKAAAAPKGKAKA